MFDLRKSVSLPSRSSKEPGNAEDNDVELDGASDFEEEKAKLDETMCAVFKFIVDRRMLPFIPIVSFDAMSLTT